MPPSSLVRIMPWEYLSGERVEPDGSSTLLNLPTIATIVELRPESEDCYFNINTDVAASAASPGYIVAGGGEIIGPLAGLLQMRVFQAAGGYIHVMYFKEATPF